MILKEEMKARSGSYDNDPWGSARNSRSGSKEALHNVGYSNTVNGCECFTLTISIARDISPSRNGVGGLFSRDSMTAA